MAPLWMKLSGCRDCYLACRFYDDWGRNGLFVLTGSEQFGLSGAVSQSLAGRTALLRLLPFSLAERRQTGVGESIDEILYSGFYLRIHDQKLEPWQALGDYFETYVERDVRRIGEVRNLSGFQRFVRLCAGRVGQLVNLSALGADAGGFARNGATMALGSRSELRRLSASPVPRQYPQTLGQVAQVVLL